ncbi:MAG: hypothetical protein AAF623_09075 [Planctomycetota bacterium]
MSKPDIDKSLEPKTGEIMRLIRCFLIVLILLTTWEIGSAQEKESPKAESHQENTDSQPGSDKTDDVDDQDQVDPEVRRFDEADLDSDGSLSFAEMKTYIDDKLVNFQQYRRLIEMMDANHDLKVDRKEFATRRELAKKLQGTPVEFTDQLNNRFDASKPFIGDAIKGLVAFDESGKAVNFDPFQGKYTVITFGCLT